MKRSESQDTVCGGRGKNMIMPTIVVPFYDLRLHSHRVPGPGPVLSK